MTIARGILVDRIRQQKREQNLWQELDRDPVLPTTTKVGGSDIDGFIASLAPADRLLLELRIFQEWSFQEIAEHLEEREGTVRVRFHRLLHRLRNRLVAAESDNA
ncbi:MAG: hypothetical protein OZSIB_0761 [Candidatus Ozemobacter sibiricus]|uniref:RNA polymerase sigma factor 70 region 4 type 2 domain-containing protein n=1 Tax=Candidatus Ozemobacter sibiricus TaxID=2268124 RepID=A0A367ZUV2_9BACT|nr:MAG: hypothetical protein OZSIB_0761 [Candidatus Ozemobacter sibiricus]